MPEEKKEKVDITSLFPEIDDVLETVNLKQVSSEGSRNDLPDTAYFLVEVEKAELKRSKSSNKPMASFQLKVVEDGYLPVVKEEEVELQPISKTKGRKVFKNYILDEESIGRFLSDMLKFEGDEPGKPLLDKEYFTTAELLASSLEVLSGHNLYIQVSHKIKDNGEKSVFYNFLSWKRVAILGLPM